MKNFLIINTSFFGDILLTGPLCRNIKAVFPDSHTVFIANKPFIDAAHHLDGVDEVIAYDKNGQHHGILGAYRFYQQYRHVFAAGFTAAFVIYGNERGIILARLFGAKKVYAENKGLIRLLLSNKNIDYHGKYRVPERNAILLEQYIHAPVKDLPMIYKPPRIAYDDAVQLLEAAGIDNTDKFICICAVSKKIEKDIPVKICAQLIDKFQSTDYKVLFLGAGSRATKYSGQLRELTTHYIDFTNKTSIAQLAAILQLSAALISVDTGTMHLGLAVDIPVTALFYISDDAHIAKWAPGPNLYKANLLKSNECSPDRVFAATLNIIGK
ncbi:glycosyltransferase family 9 protein [Pectinatus frisingensis]|uniref:glycosyltransferase family 9 protein n=1 Tax=Pectinatus frisingensis TaxID=865 RepID=UPI0015F43F2A|nr:glycosyltransferase family 9 protein [Pectinatus frisingensis]